MMSFQADRAETLFRQAAESLPEDDRKSMTAAEVMREIYQTLLRQMRADEFRVFEKRYSLPAWKKMAILAKHMIP
jgi:phytoene synthase